jgi:hypothetical protein
VGEQVERVMAFTELTEFRNALWRPGLATLRHELAGDATDRIFAFGWPVQV